ncbi:diacylglycerol/lipid kinase family protein [Nocardioides sp. Kera G14]|uniref:diacylglycerol/lipid kinase family protein n=1 Tax=Nocardioides sp. Kera G14 TaxID=2884264 RepID=UPI001D10F81A|nr:YegS/Rv2252/BmrU family lipid kinase [Nocardioides sp. Kera G14]UDY25204.1 YegS/Rv2252/BmrU family lipid kinase [Nocardioides sp. Kera G14]
MRYLLLPGPRSGRGRSADVLAGVRDRLARSGATVQVVHGETPEATAAGLRTALDVGRGSIAGVIVLGGDGMVHLAVQALGGTVVPLGIIPLGSGNDSARALGLPLTDAAAATDVILAGSTRRVDLARAGDRWFLTILATGFDAVVTERGNGLAWPRNNLRYTAAVLLELPRFTPIRYTLSLDGVEQTREAMFVSVANTDYFGGGMRIAAGASFDDGMLDVCLVKPVSRLTLLRFFPTVNDGSHVDNPIFERVRARSVTISATPSVTTYADGERFGELPMTIEAVPAALSVYVP